MKEMKEEKMDFSLSEEQMQIKALIKEFCEREVDFKELQGLADQAAKAKSVEELRALYPRDLMKKAHEVGLRQLCVPEKYGGGGFGRYSSVTRAVACEELGYHMGIGARLICVPWMILCEMSYPTHTEEQQDWFFTRYMNDPTMVVADTQTEPDGMSQMLYEDIGEGYPIKVLARRDGDEWVINGGKMWSSGGGVAGLLRCLCRTDKTAPVAKTSVNIFVPKDTPGMSYSVNRLLMGEVSGNCEISYDNVRVPVSNQAEAVGTPNSNMGFAAAKTMVFIDWLGHIQRVYEQVVAYAKERMGGGVPIIQHSGIAALLGEVALHIDATRALAYKVCWENDQREKAGKPLIGWPSNGVNYWVGKTSLLCCEAGFEIYAGAGGSLDLDLEGLVRRTFTWPQKNKTIHAIKYSMLHNDHILASQRAQIAKLKELGLEELIPAAAASGH
jgi:acyl-CoA dehydrogenase